MAPSARSDVLANLGLGIALLPAAFATSGLLRPQQALDNFGIVPTTAADGAAFHGFIRIYAARNIVISLLLAGLRYRDDRRFLGFGLLGGCFMAGIDGLVSRQLTGQGHWQHWGFIPILAGVGGLLAWQG